MNKPGISEISLLYLIASHKFSKGCSPSPIQTASIKSFDIGISGERVGKPPPTTTNVLGYFF